MFTERGGRREEKRVMKRVKNKEENVIMKLLGWWRFEGPRVHRDGMNGVSQEIRSVLR